MAFVEYGKCVVVDCYWVVGILVLVLKVQLDFQMGFKRVLSSEEQVKTFEGHVFILLHINFLIEVMLVSYLLIFHTCPRKLI